MNLIKSVYLTLVLGIFFGLFSCSPKNNANSGKLKLKFVPPGTNHLYDKLFIDEAEVTNLSWREYMYWTRRVFGDESPEFKATLPDTLVWKNCYNDFVVNKQQYCTNIKTMSVVYLRYTHYSHHPVVGISFEQAKQFCAWRTNRVNEVYYVNENKHVTFPIDSSHVIPRRVNFRIPTEEEWEFAAKAGFDTLRFITNDYKLYFNTSETALLRTVDEEYEKFIPMKDMSLKPDRNNRYHLIGNVAEMTDKKGVAKGGSYIHSTDESYYTKRIKYSKPEYWLGFRCVCEVL